MTQQSSTSDTRAALARLLQEKKQAYSYPLSYGQQALWFVCQNAPDSPAYNMALPVELQGSLNLTALQTALQTLVNRHPALRTTIDVANDPPVQTVQPAGEYHWKVHQAAGLSEQELQAALKIAYEKPFDFTRGPVLRADVFQTDPQRHILLLTMHHIFGDAGSVNILLNEMLTLYQAELAGSGGGLPSLPGTYADFVRAEIAMISSSQGEKSLEYWRNKLAGESVLSLPTDYPRPAVQTYNGASVPFSLPPELSRELSLLARAEKSTLFTLLLTAFQILLHRYTGETEIRIGSPVSAGRSQPEFAGIVGYLINPVVLRASLTSDISFRELLSRNRQTVSEAIEHAAYPFPLLVKTLQPRRDPSYTPLFQVMLDFKPADFSTRSITGLTVSSFDMDQLEGQFDLTLNVVDEDGLMQGRLNYNRDLFEAETVERMAAHFEVLLTGIAENPEQSVSRLPLVTEKEIRQLRAWNDTAGDYPKDRTLVDLFELQVEKTPDNIALIFEDQQLTYRQLNEKVNQLAYYLLSLRTREGKVLLSDNPLIAIYTERSPEMVIGLLAILKAGGAYVPMDPEYPKDRILYMLADSAAPVLLTQRSLKADLPMNELEHECVALCVDETDFTDQPTENPTVNRQPEDLAYVIYTSGSTGKPKGCLISHHNVTRLFYATDHWYGFNEQDVWTLFHSYAFDFSVWELWGAFLYGGRLVIVPYQVSRSPEDFHALLVRHQVTVLNQIPSAFQQLIQADRTREDTLALRYVIFGGEALEPAALEPWFAKHGDRQPQLINMYGITETTVHVTYHPLSHDSVRSSGSVIGRPIPDLHAYVVDAQQQIVPVGIPGELFISGAGLARAYLNRPELTDERFTEIELFGKTERVYKTGDLVKRLPDGNLEYLGRIDHQIKLRGFRIELGEIEAALLQFPEVRESVVLVRKTDEGHKQLVAYLITEKQDDQVTDMTLKLKAHLKQKLPDYMVPAFFVFIERLPLTPSGKIDRRALPEPTVRKSGYVNPRDETELRLVRLWEKLFNISPVGVTDDFFESGGDSLLAIRMVSHIRLEFGADIPLHALFQNRTIEELACRLRDGAASAWSPLVCLQTRGEKTPFFFVHASGGSAFNATEIAAIMGDGRPFYAFHPRGAEPGESFHASIEEMAADYVSAIRSVQAKGPYLLAGWSFGGTVIFEMARILEQAGETVPLLIMVDAPEPLASVCKEDDVEFLMDRVPYCYGMTLDEQELRNSREAQFAYLLKVIRMSGMFRPDIDQDYAMNWFNLYKHHNRIVGLYKPAGPVRSKIIFFKPSEKIPFDTQMGNPSQEWKPFALGGMEVCDAPGNHFTMISPVNTPTLVRMVKEYIETQFGGQ